MPNSKPSAHQSASRLAVALAVSPANPALATVILKWREQQVSR
jgi:hypothetical protein